MKISEIKACLAQKPSANFLAAIDNDPRKGVQQALKLYYKKVAHLNHLKEEFTERLRYEKNFWHHGIKYIAGIDEVGRGPLAGPVVAAAVVLPATFDLLEVNDSKQLTAAKRQQLYPLILQEALAVGIGIVDNHIIDKINIYQATRLAMTYAVQNLTLTPQQLIIDALELDIDIPQLKLVKGDSRSISVASASIIAKVCRDHLMIEYDQLYPGYDFAHNVGYGTHKHLLGLKHLGITPIHRQSFAPVQKIIKIK